MQAEWLLVRVLAVLLLMELIAFENEGCLGEALPLARVGYLKSLDHEVFLDPPPEIYHVGHKLGVQHASFIARD